MIPDTLKGVSRATDKIMGDYRGDASRIKDLVRATVVMNGVGDAGAVMAAIEKKFPTAVLKKNDLDPSLPPPREDGYRDISYNVKIDGHPVELQANIPEMLAAKNLAHPYYAEHAELERKIKSEGREPTSAENAKLDELTAEQRAIYEAAWAKATSSRNLSSDTSDASLNRPAMVLGSSESQRLASIPGSLASGMSSQTANLVPSGNLSGNAIGATSNKIITDSQAGGKVNPAQDALQSADRMVSESPDLMVNDGYDADGKPLLRPASEVLAEAQADHAKEVQEAEMAKVAIACFQRRGD